MHPVEKKTHFSEAEYFAYEESIEGRAEYYNGEIFDMAGGSENHSSISQNLAAEIRERLKGKPCRVHSGDFRLRINTFNSFVRPDVWVICGKTDKYKDRNDTAMNPMLVVEVQSKSTTVFDRRGKFQQYMSVPSLQEYVLVEQDEPQVDLYYRNPSGIWEFRKVTDVQGEVMFQSLGFSVPMNEIYLHVDFQEEE
jgi:Uma2 family endonuclease